MLLLLMLLLLKHRLQKLLNNLWLFSELRYKKALCRNSTNAFFASGWKGAVSNREAYCLNV